MRIFRLIGDHIVVLAPAAVILMVVIMFTYVIGGAAVNESNRIDYGIIVDKRMSAGGTYYSSNKNGGSMHSYPPSWSFTIRGEKDGEIVEYSFDVSEDEYNEYKIGDEYRR